MYVVYGKGSDVFTIVVKNELRNEGIEFDFIDVNQNPEAEKFLEDKLGMFQASILPQVFDDKGDYVGGHDVLKKIS